MDNRVANNQSRIPGANSLALTPPRLPLGSNGPVTLNTMDAASFSARPTTGAQDLDSVETKIRELDQRISALESSVGQIGQDPQFAAQNGGVPNNQPRPAAVNNAPAYNNAPLYNSPVAN
ncbi:MAG: hypothetical protein JWM80_2816, partial [Cyanobacteria bacterium RYN_339]|nr:hypothetical protein [Cyanobacteria bacterium RYN_339]